MTTKTDAAMRFNSGYWDGKAARERGRLPVWAKPSRFRPDHPFDRFYGNGFWDGWYDEMYVKSEIALLAERYRNAHSAVAKIAVSA